MAALDREEYRYNANVFGIAPQSSAVVIQNSLGLLPASHKNYFIYNIGRTEVLAEVLQGTNFGWIGPVVSHTVGPGEKHEFNTSSGKYIITGLKIYNKTDKRAIVHANQANSYVEFVPREPYAFNSQKSQELKNIFNCSVKYVPYAFRYVTTGFTTLLETYWPLGKQSIWEELRDNIAPLVDEKILEIVSGIILGDLKSFERQIINLIQETQLRENTRRTATACIALAEDMIGFENKFSFYSKVENYKDTNYILLPYYSNIVFMKTVFYCNILCDPSQVNMNDSEINRVKSYAALCIHAAKQYIREIYEERVERVYNESFAEDIYNNMMNTRTYISIHGLEYIPIWDYMLAHPHSDEKIYNDVISYSQFFGRQTPNLIKEAVSSVLGQPLTPHLIAGIRNKMKSIDVYGYLNKGRPKIGGMKITFENDYNYMMGTISAATQHINCVNALLTKLVVYGDGALEQLEFHFSDGREVSCGEDEPQGLKTVFELKDHHIASLILTSDHFSLGGQAANIAVSYQLARGVNMKQISFEKQS